MKIRGSKNRTLAPGEQEKISFAVATKGRSNKVSKSFQLMTNDSENQRVRLYGTAPVRSPFVAEPRLVNFGNINRAAEEMTRTVTLLRGDGPPIKPELLPVSHRNFQAELKEVEAGEKYELTVHMSPPWPPGRLLRYALRIKTGLEEAPVDEVSVMARFVQRLNATPQQILVPPNLQRDRVIRVRLLWTGGPPAEITAVESSDERIDVQLRGAGANPALLVTIPAGYEPGEDGAQQQIVLKTTDPKMEEMTIPIRAFPRRNAAPPRATRTISPGQVVGPPAPPSKN